MSSSTLSVGRWPSAWRGLLCSRGFEEYQPHQVFEPFSFQFQSDCCFFAVNEVPFGAFQCFIYEVLKASLSCLHGWISLSRCICLGVGGCVSLWAFVSLCSFLLFIFWVSLWASCLFPFICLPAWLRCLWLCFRFCAFAHLSSRRLGRCFRPFRPLSSFCLGWCTGFYSSLFSLPLWFSMFWICLRVWVLVSILDWHLSSVSSNCPWSSTYWSLCFCLPLVGRVRGFWFSSVCPPNLYPRCCLWVGRDGVLARTVWVCRRNFLVSSLSPLIYLSLFPSCLFLHMTWRQSCSMWVHSVWDLRWCNHAICLAIKHCILCRVCGCQDQTPPLLESIGVSFRHFIALSTVWREVYVGSGVVRRTA